MISKHRNKAIGWMVVTAVIVLVAFIVGQLDIRERRASEIRGTLVIFLLLGGMATWLVGGVKLAKAKGYDGGVAMGVLLVGYLVPVISILMPLIILFGFEDKTKNRRSRF